MNGAQAIDALLQGYPAEQVKTDQLEPPYDGLVLRLASADKESRAKVYEGALRELPEATAQAVRQKVAAVGQQADQPTAGPKDDTTFATKPYNLQWAEEALKPQPPIEWIADGLFQASTVSIVFGEPGSKKTWAMLDAAVCTALGKAWLGHRTKLVTVLVIDEESGPRRLKRRLGNSLRFHGASSATPIAFTSLEMFNLREPANIGRLRAVIRETGARFIVIDALADVMAGGDENSVKDTQPIFQALRKLANEFDAAIVVIHHSGKNGEYRGSSALKGCVDLMIKVESKSDATEIIFRSTKERDVERFRFSALISIEEDQTLLTAIEDAKRSIQGNRPPSHRCVLGVLLDNGPGTIKSVQASAEAQGITANAARQAIYALAKEDLVTRLDEGAQGVKATYGLTAKGRELAERLASGGSVP